MDMSSQKVSYITVLNIQSSQEEEAFIILAIIQEPPKRESHCCATSQTILEFPCIPQVFLKEVFIYIVNNHDQLHYSYR